MAKTPVYNCELEVGDKTMYGAVVALERISDVRVKVTFKDGQYGPGERVSYLNAGGVTHVRTGKDAREVGL